MALQVQRLSATACLPVRGSDEAAGYDLAACLRDEAGAPRGRFTESGTITLRPGARALIPTGLAFTVPEGTYGRIGPRSGLALRHGIDTLAGIVDRDYTDEVGVVLVNLGQEPFAIEHGMRIAQLVIERIETPDVIEVAQLSPTVRGTGGFGSTGV
ncbi:dUTP diphosphatase (plasmid) [Cereibacter azotoformans]|uniref:dUTP diphosphatase n=1 Tax=Cereibacter azotoformans TaxID=43057 RepID=UPI003B21746B